MDNLYGQLILAFAIVVTCICLQSIPMDIIIYDIRDNQKDKLYALKHWSAILFKLLIIILLWLGVYLFWSF